MGPTQHDVGHEVGQRPEDDVGADVVFVDVDQVEVAFLHLRYRVAQGGDGPVLDVVDDRSHVILLGVALRRKLHGIQ